MFLAPPGIARALLQGHTMYLDRRKAPRREPGHRRLRRTIAFHARPPGPDREPRRSIARAQPADRMFRGRAATWRRHPAVTPGREAITMPARTTTTQGHTRTDRIRTTAATGVRGRLVLATGPLPTPITEAIVRIPPRRAAPALEARTVDTPAARTAEEEAGTAPEGPTEDIAKPISRNLMKHAAPLERRFSWPESASPGRLRWPRIQLDTRTKIGDSFRSEPRGRIEAQDTYGLNRHYH